MALSLEQYRDTYSKNKNTMKNILTERIESQRKEALRFSIHNGNQIPENLIIEILSRLPVKALLQFKSACKLWYDIIKSSYFISKNLRNYYDNNNNWRDCLIVQYSITQAGELNVYELLIDDTENRVWSYNRIETPIYNTYMCGPCDGIYYLWSFHWPFGPTFDFREPSKRSLWNPALNELKILPKITCWKPNLPPNSTFISESYGFGYDSKTNDYKVILILGHRDTRDDDSYITDNPTSILIYSLRTNSWRHWGDLDNIYNVEWANKSYVFVNGRYYWRANRVVTDDVSDEIIFSFDLSADTCHELPLPRLESEPKYRSELIVYQDSIGFVYIPENNTSFCIWTWNEGVWTQKFSMKLDFSIWGAISEWRDNMLVLKRESWKLFLLDTNTKEIFVLDDPRKGGCENICAYKESLVSINDFGKDFSIREEKADKFPSMLST